MNDAHGSAGEPGEGPEVGSVGEEAAKLFGVLADWARTQTGPDQPTTQAPPSDPDRETQGLADALRNLNGHVAGEDCRFCPVCQVIHAVRETSPEVKTHLAVAAGSLMQAVAGLLSTTVPKPGSQGVEKIDLSDDAPWDDPR
ncbi:MAG: hypothetical protein JWO46_2305 [Nocardioidaceae bacterium]|nr:hypothetical protein [Nocardioidaceae bacterium]